MSFPLNWDVASSEWQGELFIDVLNCVHFGASVHCNPVAGGAGAALFLVFTCAESGGGTSYVQEVVNAPSDPAAAFEYQLGGVPIVETCGGGFDTTAVVTFSEVAPGRTALPLR